MKQFNEEQLEVLRSLGLEHKYVGDLVIDILVERYSLPEWMLAAASHGWGPPREWFQEERSRITPVIRDLLLNGIIGHDVEWRLHRRSGVSALQLLGEQSS